MASFDQDEGKSLLDKLDSIAPIREFDAFPKVANTYTQRTSLGGIATVLVIVASFLLSLNDIGEFLWGWPDFEYGVDRRLKSSLDINLDMVVNMPCAVLTVDVRDAVGDRLHLSSTFARDGTVFDAGQAHAMQSHGEQKSVSEIVTAAKKKSGGLFAAFHSQSSSYRPTYNHSPSGDACRIHGTVQVKRVTGNLHITTLGHGYTSREHTDHKLMNLTHVITEFSFGPFFPNIAQPLDYTYELAEEPFTLFQYFLTVVPTVYHAPRSKPLRTNQYSVNSYRRTLHHGRGTPGIFFKFDIDPMEMSVYQRTTSFTQFLLRLCGVVGGVWVCAGWAVKVGAKAATVVVGKKDDGQIVSESELKKRVSKRWAGGELRARGSSVGWTIDGASPYSATFSPYATTPSVNVNGYPASPGTPNGGYAPSMPTTPQGPYSPGGAPLIRTPMVRSVSGGSVNGNSPVPHSPVTPPQRGESHPTSPISPYAHANGNGVSPARPKSNLGPKRTD